LAFDPDNDGREVIVAEEEIFKIIDEQLSQSRSKTLEECVEICEKWGAGRFASPKAYEVSLQEIKALMNK